MPTKPKKHEPDTKWHKPETTEHESEKHPETKFRIGHVELSDHVVKPHFRNHDSVNHNPGPPNYDAAAKALADSLKKAATTEPVKQPPNNIAVAPKFRF